MLQGLGGRSNLVLVEHILASHSGRPIFAWMWQSSPVGSDTRAFVCCTTASASLAHEAGGGDNLSADTEARLQSGESIAQLLALLGATSVFVD